MQSEVGPSIEEMSRQTSHDSGETRRLSESLDPEIMKEDLERIEGKEIPRVVQSIEILRQILEISLEIERVSETDQEHGRIILESQYRAAIERLRELVGDGVTTGNIDAGPLEKLHTSMERHGTPELHLQDIRSCQAHLSTLRSRAETLKTQLSRG